MRRDRRAVQTARRASGHFWANRGYYGSINHDVKAHLRALSRLVRRQPGHAAPAAAGRGGQEIRRVHGRCRRACSRRRKESYDDGRLSLGRRGGEQRRLRRPEEPGGEGSARPTRSSSWATRPSRGPWRNFYLAGAQELRNGVAELPTPNTASPDTLRAMDLDLFFDYLGGAAERARRPTASDSRAQLRLHRHWGRIRSWSWRTAC